MAKFHFVDFELHVNAFITNMNKATLAKCSAIHSAILSFLLEAFFSLKEIPILKNKIISQKRRLYAVS